MKKKIYATFASRFSAILCVQQIPGRMEILEKGVSSIRFFLRSSCSAGTAAEVRRSILENPKTMKIVLRKARAMIKLNDSAHGKCEDVRVRECDLVGDSRLVSGSVFLALSLTFAARCWRVLGEIVVYLTELAVRKCRRETPEQQEKTRDTLTHIVHWIITETVADGELDSQVVLAEYLSKSKWKSEPEDGQDEISAARLLRMCTDHSEYMSLMPSVANFITLNVPGWNFSWEILAEECEVICRRIRELRSSAEEVLADKKARMNKVLLDVMAANMLGTLYRS
jgi:hypothetical protein